MDRTDRRGEGNVHGGPRRFCDVLHGGDLQVGASCLLETWWDDAIMGAAVVAKDGRFLAANPAFCSILEYSETELMERTFQEITHPEDVGADIKSHEKILQGDSRRYDMAKRYITKTGRVIWVKIRVSGIWNSDVPGGNPVFVSFLSQVANVLEVKPGNGGAVQYPGRKNYPSAMVGALLREYWVHITALLGATAYILAEVIKYLHHK